MGDLIVLDAHHARACSDGSGRGTPSGQTASAGQRAENHSITSSYLRAVNVVDPASTRSKKRQSPAACFAMVDRLNLRATAKADAHAMRFLRSSVSMAEENSRIFPTLQAQKVGNFPLAHSLDKSDISAMQTANDIRRKIESILEERSVGAVAIVSEMIDRGMVAVDRNYLRDFLKGKKGSLSFDFSQALADFFGIPVQEFRVSKPSPHAVIRKGARPHLYITEHMAARGLDDETLAGRLAGITPEAFAGWRARPEQLQEWQIAAVLHAFGLDDITTLTRPPEPKKAKKSSTRAGGRWVA